MNPASLPAWLNAVLVFLLFVVAPSTAHLLGPFETDAIQAVALDKADAINDAQRAQKE